MRIYITPNQKITAPLLEVLPAYELERDSEPSDPESLTGEGWRYAQYERTGYRVLVNVNSWTRRYSKGWNCYVFTVQVREVETVPNEACTGVCADLGAPAQNMIVREEYLKCIDHAHAIMNWRN